MTNKMKTQKLDYSKDPALLSDEEKEYLREIVKTETSNFDEVISNYYDTFYTESLAEIESINAKALDARYSDEESEEKSLLEMAEKRQEWLNEHLEAVMDVVRSLNFSEEDFDFRVPSYEMNDNFFDISLPIGHVLENDAQNLYSLMREGVSTKDAVDAVFAGTYGEAYKAVKEGCSSRNRNKKIECKNKLDRLNVYKVTMEAYSKILAEEMKGYRDALAHNLHPDTYSPIQLSNIEKAMVRNWLKVVPSKETEQAMAKIYSKLGNKKNFEEYVNAVNRSFSTDEMPYYVSKYYFTLCQDGVLKVEKAQKQAANAADAKPVVEKAIDVEPINKPVAEIAKEEVAKPKAPREITFDTKELKYLASIGIDTDEKIKEFADKVGGLGVLKNSLGIVLKAKKDFKEKFAPAANEPGEE